MLRKNQNTKVIIFDFDGTLVLSNEIKRETYFEVARNLLGHTDNLEKCISQTNGDRRQVFTNFLNENKCSFNKLNLLVERYTTVVEEKIMKLNLVDGVENLLSLATKKRIDCYVNTATPIDAINRILIKKKLRKYFIEIYGNYGEKDNNLKKIIAKYTYANKNYLIVGDGIDDYEYSIKSSIPFLAVGCNPNLQNLKKTNFYEICELIN